MKVHPSQLIPGCLVIKDVKGKTNRPIMQKNTVLDEELIEILQKFLVKEVEVSPRLSEGTPFIPGKVSKQKPTEKRESQKDKAALSYHELYLDAVDQYKHMFHDWQNGKNVNITNVRQLINPLLERIDEVGLSLYNFHQNSTKDDYLYHHSIVTSLLAAFLAKKSPYKNEWMQIGTAGFLADCGMAKIDEQIVKKEGTLTSEEYEEIKKHPVLSYRLVEKIPSLSQGIKLAILQHHERLDRSGYPLGVGGDKIHPYARFIAISDIYHAMTSERIYQPQQSPFKVIEEMVYEQFGKLDHPLVQSFVSSLTNFGTGTRVRLSNQQQAEIVFVEVNYPTRPMVRLDTGDKVISLKDDQSIYIDEILT
ncbi:HD-GYP domain-containing protein [Sediminibacillus albus]|uniref:HD-GYP domain, c-di-GMP phosphodiesterase class II (Or its inactivated variant) n=1 Tax=Sediminibacillus albus TaxID=407036 RepID=A0A1G9A7R0_9BACI|nr:HD-GYP domain-containing protein [Sediminibacillus albus]SDK23328.1 HD-GYP domain, c-di-GMP phosphodiesterase class II (or its inactivated variant) [Sediminibacillus albus]